jgi:putative aldouronate transport system permease protein
VTRRGESMMKRLSVFDILLYIFLTLFALACALPLLLVASISFTSEDAITRYGYALIPAEFSLDAYRMLFSSVGTVASSYLISILMTVIGTASAVLITASAGYTLANQNVKYRNLLALFFFIPMLFSAGLVPWYLINAALGLKDNFLALVVPRLMFNAFNMFLVRNYMKSLPAALGESAKIDGASEFVIAFRIYFPLSVPVLATIALFYGMGYWDDWYNAVMLVSNPDLYPLQYLLFQIQNQINMSLYLKDMGIESDLPSESFKMATVIVTIGPIVLLYPYLQRYFLKGLIIGSVKE